MTTDISRLSDEERQELADALHNASIYPSRLVGIGSPAHVEAINSNLNDLRQMMSMQAANIARFYEIVAPKAAASARRPVQELRPNIDAENNNE